jgi:predicted ATPase/predicted Ser/Thr protein kinase
VIGATLNERYRIEEELGKGGMGLVYRAYDEILKRDVAVKIMSKTRLGTEGRARMLREAQTVANLRHSNIVVVYDAGKHEETPFIVMELVEGQTLSDKKPGNLEEIVQVAKQICKALDHAHQQGIVHRDLKPENVIVEPDGNLKLMDFGLAHSVATRMTSEGTIMGTVFYMAPEQVTGEELDGRVDLYALGVMLYEFITGVLPFEGENPVAIITQHLNAPLVPPRAKRDDLPPKLNDLIVSLLEKERENRPASAAVLLNLLDDPRLLDMRATAEHELSTLDRIVLGRMIGRSNEYTQARQLWNHAADGQGQLLFISGEPGVGKTRLMREIITQAEVSGGQTFVGECHPEGNTPYSAFAQIVRRVLREHAKNGYEFPPPVLADMLKLSPELKLNFPDVVPNPALDPEADQRRLMEHMVGFCQVMTAQAPLMLVLEDVHWADSSTLTMMNKLARRTAGIPVMILGTYREVELDDALPFHQTLQDLIRQNLGKRIKLERLDKENTRNLLATIFDEEITPKFLDGIYQETDGNPFFIEEVCKALVDSGQLRFIENERRWDRPSMEELRIPQGVKVAIQSRVTKLSDDTQDILLFAAVIGRVFDYPTLVKVTEKDEDSLIDCLEEALHAQLLEEIRGTGGEKFNFSHALIPRTLRERVSGLRRSRLHHKVAAAIEETVPEDYERLAHHWGEAGNDEKGLDYTIKAAGRARQTYANQEAVRLYTEALSLLPEDHPQRFDLLAGRAQVYRVINQYEHQKRDAETMLVIAEKQNDNHKKMDALLELADYYLATDAPRTNEYADQVIALAKSSGDKGRLGQAYSLLGAQNQLTYNVIASQEYFEKAAALLKEAGLVKQAAKNLSYLSVVLGLMDKEAAVQAAQEALDLSKQSGDKLLEAIATRRVAISKSFNYQFEDAYETVQTALDLFRMLGDRSGELHSINVRGILHNALGNFQESEQDYLSVLEISEEIGHETGLRWGINNIQELYNFSTGEYEKGLMLAEIWTEKCLQMGRQITLADYSNSIAFQLFVLGQYRRSLEILKENLPAYDQIYGLAIQSIIRFFIAHLHFLLEEEDEGKEIFKSTYKLYTGNEFDPLFNLYIWNLILSISLLQPGIFPIVEILAEMDTFINNFRDKKELLNLLNALYSVSNIHLAIAEQDSTHIEKALAALYEAEKLKKTVRTDTFLIEQQLYTHARAHYLAGQDDEADRYLEQAYKWLMACADKITTPEYRLSYLENVPENVEIQAAYHERFSS